MWVDVHLHLTDETFRGEEEAVLRRAEESGIAWVVTSGVDLESSERAVELARRHPGRVWATVGVHPHEARLWDEGSEAALERLAADPHVVAVGEIGLDFHYDHSPRDVQARVFRRQIRLARKLGLPVVIHSREAPGETLAALREEGRAEGLLHCFHGDQAFAREVLDLGLFVSVGGMLTFRSMDGLRQVVTGLPRERVCLETDAPYLAPVPHRGRRNEPAWVIESGRVLATLWHMEPLEAARLTAANARRLFRRADEAARTKEA
ncbi:hydrolase TatD [Limnochorda pilosa]|uniref:Hydrolase TatD n=1 Tax=Limnochorda pilosa TaxID=1555112 RepID=A0A0K2SPE8_LIMPI|nr:hydrolase TatD [Limnochorda pilosa]